MKKTKRYLLREVSRATGIKQKDAEKACLEFIRQINRALIKGDTIEIRGWGTWYTRKWSARTGTSPRDPTHIIHIPETRYIRFKPVMKIKEILNA